MIRQSPNDSVVKWAFLGAAFALLVASSNSIAFTFVPTADEWETWPSFCKARYDTLELSRETDFANRIPESEIEHWKSVLGPAFLSVHHYCAALVEFRQAMVDSISTDREFHLAQALGDAQYTFDRIELTSLLAPETGALLAQIKFELGRADQARDVLHRVIAAQPSADRPYLVLAMIDRKRGDVVGAIKILEDGNKSTEFKSAEINYTLGLLYFDRKDYQSARECAARAYDLGYPLPGLRKKLQQIGQ